MPLGSTSEFCLGPPLIWLTASAFFAAAALGKVLVKKARTDTPPPKRTCQALIVYGVLALGFGIVGYILSSAADATRFPLFVFYATLTVLFLLVVRLKRLTSLIMLIPIAIAVLAITFLLQAITAFTGETSIASLEVLGADEDGMTLKIERDEDVPVEIHMKGEYFAPIVKVVIFDDLSVLFGAKTWYRFVGMTSFGIDIKNNTPQFRQADTDYYFENKSGLSETLYDVFERFETVIPGVKTVQVEMDLKRVFVSHQHTEQQRFALMIQNDGGLQIVPAPQ